eukprot:8181703-Pyramimonas_sp.AAC.1
MATSCATSLWSNAARASARLASAPSPGGAARTTTSPRAAPKGPPGARATAAARATAPPWPT